MNSEKFTDYDCRIIARKIQEKIFRPSNTYNTSVFLCGAKLSDKNTIRSKVANTLKLGSWYGTHFDLIYPENLFDELLKNLEDYDLLSLENMLAESVDVIVVIPESPGSYAELGAFANNEKVRAKMVCVMNREYKNVPSFINLGPVKLITNHNKDGVVYIDVDALGNTSSETDDHTKITKDKEIDKIRLAIRKTIKLNPLNNEKVTLLQLDKFLLSAIYLLEPVNLSTLSKIASHAIDNERYADSAAKTAVSMLKKDRLIYNFSEFYKLTPTGLKEYLNYSNKRSSYKQQERTKELDNLRLEILNLIYRKKKMKV